MENEELWKDIIGYNGKYQISNYGRVKRVKSSSLLTSNGDGRPYKKDLIYKLNTDTKGYYFVCLWNSSTYSAKGQWVARLVAIHFIDNHDNLPIVNHINGIKTDNHVDNLEWVTYRENNSHKFLTKESNYNSKYIGVKWCSSKKRWITTITFIGKLKTLGRFKNERSAALCYLKFIQENGIKNKYLFKNKAA